MNQQEVVLKLKQKTRLSTNELEETMKALKEIVYEALENGEKVQLLGFGTYYAKERKERKGTNPRTKQDMLIPATIVPAFKPGKEFLQKLAK